MDWARVDRLCLKKTYFSLPAFIPVVVKEQVSKRKAAQARINRISAFTKKFYAKKAQKFISKLLKLGRWLPAFHSCLRRSQKLAPLRQFVTFFLSQLFHSAAF